MTGVVAALIAQDPGVRRVDQDDPQGERAIRLLAQMLVRAGLGLDRLSRGA